MKKTFLISLAAALPFVAGGAVVYSGTTYSQNFDSLSWNPSESQFTFVNDTTLSGWTLSSTTYRANWNGSEPSNNLGTTEVKSLQILTEGTHAENNRVWDGDTRLGARTGSALGNFFATLELSNGTGGTLNSFTVGYEAAQFYARDGGAIDVRYSFDNTNWTTIDGSTAGDISLRYNAPVISSGVSRAVTQTELNDSITSLSSTVSGVNWNSGSSLYIQFAFWRDIPGGTSGSSPVLSINDVTVAVPEPSTMALMAGFAALGLILLRRWRA